MNVKGVVLRSSKQTIDLSTYSIGDDISWADQTVPIVINGQIDLLVHPNAKEWRNKSTFCFEEGALGCFAMFHSTGAQPGS